MAVQPLEKAARYLHVKVVDELKDGRPVVNVRVPTGVVKFGLEMAKAFSPEMRDAQVDWENVKKIIDEGVVGEIAHVEDEGAHKVIDVWLE